jgi:phage-related protein
MARKEGTGNERPVFWVGSSKSDFLGFAEPVRRKMGYALGVAQRGGKHPRAKPWKGEGPGVFEIVEDWDGDAFRAIYTVRFEEAVYVLHAFQKKSPSGVRTAGRDIDLVRARMRRVQAERERQE